MSNQRRHPRAPLRARCWCEADGITLYARIVNVGEGGLFIRTYAPLQRGAPARVRFQFEGAAGEVAAEAVVVWVREAPESESQMVPGMGMQFVAIDEPSLKLIREYVTNCSLAA
jgi:uncharacterized protein (TIGR02266 family)